MEGNLGMKHRRLVALLLALLLGGTLTALALGSPADASMPIAQVARLRDQAPVSGTFNTSYKNYGEQACVSTRDCPAVHYYRVAKGVLRTKLNTYVIKEEMRRYDFYLLDVDAALTDQSGTATLGNATLRVHTVAPDGTVVDSDDSKSITKDPQACQSFPVSVGAGVGWNGLSAGASIDVGSVRFCSATASFTVRHSSGDAIYTASRIPKIQRLNLGRIVKVKAGTKPRFRVTLTYPMDSCTQSGKLLSGKSVCFAYANGTKTVAYRIGTSG
jgi:hypothetical protein